MARRSARSAGTLAHLKAEARGFAERRGHRLAPWESGARRGQAYALCRNCPAGVVVIAKPAPNEAQIAGEAVATECRGTSQGPLGLGVLGQGGPLGLGVLPEQLSPAPGFASQSARDAQAAGYGDPSYWAYLDAHAKELREYYAARGDPVTAAKMMTEALSEALRGNEGA